MSQGSLPVLAADSGEDRRTASAVVSRLSDVYSVELVPWPGGSDRRGALAEQGLPRLLMVVGEDPPPDTSDPLEDWVRLPASDLDISMRRATLAARANLSSAARPVLDGDGVLRAATRLVSLPPIEAKIAEALLDRFSQLVLRQRLLEAGWSDPTVGRNALDVHILRLRRRLQVVGLAISTVRSRGYVLHWAPTSARRHRM